MASEFRLFSLGFLLFALVNNAICQEEEGTRNALVPAMFIFGDSLIDNGNNNNLPSFAKANYFPYGIDFNGGPTGRFSNGYTMVDVIGNIHTFIHLFIFVFFSKYFIFQPFVHGIFSIFSSFVSCFYLEKYYCITTLKIISEKIIYFRYVI